MDAVEPLMTLGHQKSILLVGSEALSGANTMRDEDHLDPKGYWCDPDGNIRRMSGDQEIIAKKTEKCSEAEWNELLRVTSLIEKGTPDRVNRVARSR